MEQRVSQLEEESQEDHFTITSLQQTTQQLQEKLDDLENRSRRNNLRIVGLPKPYKAGELYKPCTKSIPQVLGLTTKCMVKRAHRLRGYNPDRKTLHQVTARYLNHTDKNLITQKFRNKGELQIEGHNLLLLRTIRWSYTIQKKENFQRHLLTAP